MNPLVSIIIPVYNRDKVILETLNSIDKQSYINWECILVDDGSTDNSFLTIKKHIENNPKFTLVKRPENKIKGANSCRNFGFELSKGKYINWFDSDDIMHPDFLKNKINAFTSSIDCVISKTCFFVNNIENITGKEVRTNLSDNLIEDFVVLKSSWYLPDPMWKKSFLLGKPLFSEKLMKGQDRDFHIKMLLHKPKIKIIDFYGTYYRQHENTISNSASTEVMKSYFEAVRERITLLLQNKLSNNLKTFLLKNQIKNYPYVYKEKEIVKYYIVIFKKLFTFNFQNFKLLIKFLMSIVLFNLTGKGSFLLKG